MLARRWPVTFSMGVVTYSEPPSSVGEMVAAADSMMYGVKRSEKGGVWYRTVVGELAETLPAEVPERHP